MTKNRVICIQFLICMSLWIVPEPTHLQAELPWIEVSADKSHFVTHASHQPFRPWGVNYDHDEMGRLIEDYWNSDWTIVESDFAEIKSLGANVVRIHLQLGKFMVSAKEMNHPALDQLMKLVTLAEDTGVYLNLTGLGCYHKADVPDWYDVLSEEQRWAVQAQFWSSIAARCSDRSAIFCYDLMNEPVVPGGRRNDLQWLGPAFAGKHFVQFITLDQRQRPRHEIAKQWIDQLVTEIRKVDRRHLTTVGLVDWSLEGKGITSGFVPHKVTQSLDFISVHIYPETGKMEDAQTTLQGFSIGKPIVVEETYPLKCSPVELDRFIDVSYSSVAGWISFYWGKSREELQASNQIADAIQLQWLDLFASRRDKR